MWINKEIRSDAVLWSLKQPTIQTSAFCLFILFTVQGFKGNCLGRLLRAFLSAAMQPWAETGDREPEKFVPLNNQKQQRFMFYICNTPFCHVSWCTTLPMNTNPKNKNGIKASNWICSALEHWRRKSRIKPVFGHQSLSHQTWSNYSLF